MHRSSPTQGPFTPTSSLISKISNATRSLSHSCFYATNCDYSSGRKYAHLYSEIHFSQITIQLGGKCATGLVCVLNKANTFNVFTAAGGHIERIERKSVD